MRNSLLLLLLFLSGYASAHSWTPTYPVFKPSYMDKVLETEMLLFNKREDVEYFEVMVTDEEFNKLPFVSTNHIYKASYLERVKVQIFIREEMLFKAMYICSRSRFLKQEIPTNMVSSRICSKIR